MATKILSQEVYEWMLRRLLSGALRPGDLLNRRKIATQFGVSVAPVLETMVKLEMEGFLETIPRQGTRVRMIDTEDVHGSLIVRQALESQAARMYCGEPVRNEYKKLLKLAKLADKTAARSISNFKAEVAFHRGLVTLAGNRRLLETFDTTMKHSLFYACNGMLPFLPDKKIFPNSHQQLLEDLQNQLPDEAEEAVKRHIQMKISLGTAANGHPIVPQ